MWSSLNTHVTTIVMKSNYNDIIKGLDVSVIVLLDKLKRYLSVGKSSVMVGCGFSLNAECDGTGCEASYDKDRCFERYVDLYNELLC